VQAKLTERILDETVAAVHKSRPDIAPEKLARLRGLMLRAIPDSVVSRHEPLIEGLLLRDPDDRHVLAAAIKSGAQLIVTKDQDFTPEVLRPWNIEAKSPDDFILDLIDISEKVVWSCVQQIVNSRKQRPETVEDVLTQLERSGLVQSAAALRRNWTLEPVDKASQAA